MYYEMLKSAYWYPTEIVAFADVLKNQSSCNAFYSNIKVHCHIKVLKQETWINKNFPYLTHSQARLNIKHKSAWSHKKVLCVQNLGCVSVFRIRPTNGVMICTAPIFSVQSFSDFINHYKMLGINSMTFYSTHEKFDLPQKDNTTTIVRWAQLKTPKYWHGDGTTFYYSQANAYNDCLHRNLGKILLFVDRDDLIITKPPKSLPNILNTFKKSKYNAIYIQWILFPCMNLTRTYKGHDSTSIWNNFSYYKNFTNTKVIVKSNRNIEMGIHSLFSRNPVQRVSTIIAMHKRSYSGIICR